MISRRWFPYTPEEKVILNSFDYRIVFLRIVLAIIFKVFFSSITILEFLEGNHWYDYLALFSYWSVTAGIACCDLVIVTDLIRIIAFFYMISLFRNRRFSIFLGILDYIRDGLLIATLITSFITSGAFWVYYTGSLQSIFSLTYPSLMSHTMISILIVVLCLVTTIYISSWICLIVWAYSLAYFCFIIYMFYDVKRWVYDQFNPTHKGWHITFIVIAIIEVLLFEIVGVFNIWKNKLYARLQRTHFELDLVEQKLVFGRHELNYLKIELFTTSTFLLILVAYSAFILFGSMIKMQTTTLLNIVYVVVAIYVMMECIVYFVTCGNIFNNIEDDVLSGLQKFLVILLMLNISLSLIGLYSYFGTDSSWLYVAFLALSCMLMCFRLFVLYYLHRSITHGSNNDLIYMTYFD